MPGAAGQQARGGRPGAAGWSAGGVQPAHRGAGRRVPERLELVVPGLPEQQRQLSLERAAKRRVPRALPFPQAADNVAGPARAT